jgi:eukaryotic-like serine/threonine-protein kinase
MPLGPGARLGPYEIVAAIGAGGMGEVYRATDANLKRAVAIKVLPPSVASDPDRLARFQREAEVLASLNHPNIAAIYGLEKSNGTSALVMELVEGEDLSQRIARGPIALDEALPIAKQIAEALEAAHEQGVIHRDLKPANIKVRPDGTVKVLDFGLAKLTEPRHAAATGTGASASMSPTITSPAMMTGVGLLLGTAAYMSPEQAKGREADKRSDIWAFGCVLYEMLTGKRPFDGEDVSDTLANVLKIDPDWSALPSEIPSAIRTLLQSCLTKDRRRRVADISTALFVLDKGASLAPQAGAVSAAPLPSRLLWWRVAALTGVVLVVAAVTGAAVWFATRPAEPVPPRVSRLSLAASGAAALTINGADRDLAITPDGSRLVYVGNRGTQLFVRALDALEPVAVFTGTPSGPFVSLDGQWIGFVDGTTVLKKVAVTGGPAVTLATLDNFSVGSAWGPDDTIIVATSSLATGLQRVGAAGGPPTVLTRPDHAQGEADHLWPEMLPGGRAVLFTIAPSTGGVDAAQVAVLDLQTGRRKILVRGGSHAHYVPSGSGSPARAEREGGHLVYAAANTLRAVPFDLATLETRGTPVPVISDVVTKTFGAVDAAVAGDGTLAYVLGRSASGATARTLVWVDRQGGEMPIPAPPRPYVYPQLSPDGTRVAVNAQDQDNDIWIWDLSRTTLTRVTFDPAFDGYPVWTPNGRWLVFGSARAEQLNLYMQAADGTGSVTRLTTSANGQNPTAITADGTRVVVSEQTPTRQRDLRLLTLAPTGPTAGQGRVEPVEPPRFEPLLETRFEERGGIVSPDGQWLAYESNSSGRFEIYVRPFPHVGDGQWQVSTAGGVQPLWARSGRELFYLAPDGALLLVPVDPRGSAWNAGTATKLVAGHYFTGGGVFTARQYDVSPDGQRFLMIKEGGGTDQTATPPQIIVVQHFDEELKRLVPTK